MGKSRIFFPQQVVDRWSAIGEAEMNGAELWIRSERTRYRVVEAVRIVREVSGAPDPFEMTGRVKTFGFVTELGAELLGDSMIIGENAYETVMGWLASPLLPSVSGPSTSDPGFRDGTGRGAPYRGGR
jgi:hypothetical protein